MPHYASDEIEPDLTVAAAWSCLRRCWRAYKIAIKGRNNDGRDDEKSVEYAQRIVSLCNLLNIEPPYFSELDVDEDREQSEEGEEASVEGSIAYNGNFSMQSSIEGHSGNNNDEDIGDEYLLL